MARKFKAVAKTKNKVPLAYLKVQKIQKLEKKKF